MKGGILLFAVLLLVCTSGAPAQCIGDDCGLVITGKVTDLEVEKDKSNVYFYVKFDVEFSNRNKEPIILFEPWDGEGYWLGGWAVYASPTEDAEAVFWEGYWESVDRGETYQKLAANLDVKTPPAEYTRILKQGESWKFQDDFRIAFAAEKYLGYPVKKTWKEMQEFPSKLWVTISYELSPFNVEYIKPRLIRTLKKRWKRFGNVPVEADKDSRAGNYIATSEPMEIDFGAARPLITGNR
jgi:hypothetical protein